MDIKTIGVEDWLNVWEKSATCDIAQSTVPLLTMGELRALDEQDGATLYERLYLLCRFAPGGSSV